MITLGEKRDLKYFDEGKVKQNPHFSPLTRARGVAAKVDLIEILQAWSSQKSTTYHRMHTLEVIATYTSEQPGSISVSEGEYVYFLALSPNGWVNIHRMKNEETGWVPVDRLALPRLKKRVRPADTQNTTGTTMEEVDEKKVKWNTRERSNSDDKLEVLRKRRPTVLHLNLDKILNRDDVDLILKTEKKKQNPSAIHFFRPTQLKIFGGTIENICQMTGEVIPYVVSECVLYLTHTALKRQGLFRMSGVFDEVTQLKCMFSDEKKRKVNLSKLRPDPHAVSTVLKTFFASLSEPCISRSLFISFRLAHVDTSLTTIKRNEAYKDLLTELPTSPRLTLYVLLQFLHKVSQHSDVNLMNAHNLGVVFGPNLLRPVGDSSDLTIPAAVITELIENFPSIKTAMEKPFQSSNGNEKGYE
jgi:predicted  nucleic acid-binding Zn-ribbon protein